MSKEVKWLGAIPNKCDTCDAPIGNIFYDAKTEFGPWACMCPSCFAFGPGIGKLGTGLGQKFEKKDVQVFIKTEG